MISPKRKGWLAQSSGPSVDDVLPEGEHELTLIFFMPDLGIQEAQQLTLPAEGPSEERRFRFTAGEAGTPVKAWISVMHRNRALQTLELSGIAMENPHSTKLTERIEYRLAVVAPDFATLGVRPPFEGSIQVSRDASGQLVGFMTTTPERVMALPEGVDRAVEGIRTILERLLDYPGEVERDIEAPRSVSFLRDLALKGRELYDEIGLPLERFVGNRISRVQIVQADYDLFVPIEFIYDLPAPSNTATLCRNWREALERGFCYAHFHHVDDLTGHMMEICPSGFWAVGKVIERQCPEQTALGDLSSATVASIASPARDHLGSFGAALFAWSERLDALVEGQSKAVKDALKNATGRDPIVAPTWRTWAETVRDERPPLLVLLSHTTADSRLRIGPDDGDENEHEIALSQLNENFVRRPGAVKPLVMLLGCDTAVADQAMLSFAARFRSRGAAVVVGTLTSVLGENIAPVASGLVGALSQATQRAMRSSEPEMFGEVWRRTRGALLANGDLTALCLTAYGDAGLFVGSAPD